MKYFVLLLLSSIALGQPQGIPSFSIESSGIELSRNAKIGTQFDKSGHRFAFVGEEGGTFEVWGYPIKLARNCEFSFLVGSSPEPIKARDLIRAITVTPEATTLTFAHPSFGGKIIFLASGTEAGGVVLLELSSNDALTVLFSFLPVLQPMWPAGIGGQNVQWDETNHAYVLSEPSKKLTALIGSPSANDVLSPRGFLFSDEPNKLRIDFKKSDTLAGRYYPFVFAGGIGSRDSIVSIYRILSATIPALAKSNADRNKQFRQSTLQVQTPNQKLNQAYEWAKASLASLMADGPGSGSGVICGLGRSGIGMRPGPAWFFGTDAVSSAMSLQSIGSTANARSILAFMSQFRRNDGKMPHEIVQSADLVQWWSDYPYAYLRSETTPMYLAGFGEFIRATNDSTFLSSMWPGLKASYAWSRSVVDEKSGLIENKKSGSYVIESGPLAEVQYDIVTNGAWVRASRMMNQLANIMGDSLLSVQAEAARLRATSSINSKFWDDKNTILSPAITLRGEPIELPSPWCALPLMWEAADPLVSLRSIARMNSSDITTDWGIRSYGSRNRFFDPANNTYGAVRSTLGAFVSTAQFKHHFGLQGFTTLMSSANHMTDVELGSASEYYSGISNIAPMEASGHNASGANAVILPLVRGLCGIDGNAIEHKVTFAPHFPADWDRVVISNHRVGRATFAFEYTRSKTSVKTIIRTTEASDYTVTIAPAIGASSLINKIRVDGKEVPFKLIVSPQTMQPLVEIRPNGETTVELEYTPSVELLPVIPTSTIGASNQGLKIITAIFRDKQWKVLAEGIEGRTYEVSVANDDAIVATSGCDRRGNKLVVSFPGGKGSEFVRKEFSVTAK